MTVNIGFYKSRVLDVGNYLFCVRCDFVEFSPKQVTYFTYILFCITFNDLMGCVYVGDDLILLNVDEIVPETIF